MPISTTKTVHINQYLQYQHIKKFDRRRATGGAIARQFFPSSGQTERRVVEHTENQFHKETQSWQKILTKTFLEEFQQVALEKYEFENRHNMQSNWNFSHFRLIIVPIQEAK